MSTDAPLDHHHLAAALRAEMGVRRLNANALASRCGVSQRTLTRYVIGERDIPFDALCAIARGLEMSVSELVTRAEARAAVTT